jgi:hypothetical protein
VLLHLSYSNAIAQNIDLTTGVISPVVSMDPNIVVVGTNNTTTTTNSTGNLLSTTGWTGIGYGNSSTVGQCCSGGPTAVMNTDTNTIRFSYGWSTASQTIAITNALFEATGIRISGYTASALVNNGGQNTGPLSGSVSVKNNLGSVIDTQTFDLSNLNNDGNFDKVSLTRYFANPYQISELGSITASWTGKDDRYWAGFYGPRVRDSSLTLQYYVDPCIRNPASSPSCSGYNSLLTSINIVPYPNSSATDGNPLNNSFPIATALSNSGSGLALHGFKYGFTYDLGQGSTECTATNQDGSCSWWKTISPVASVKVDIRNSSNQSLFSQAYNFNKSNTGPQSMAYQYLFSDSTNTNVMGNFGFNASVSGQGSVYNMYSKLIVTPDPCTANPYSSSKCSGFTESIAKLSGTNTTDYGTTGYTEPATVTASTMAPTTPGSSTNGVVVDPNAIASVQPGQPQQVAGQPQQGQQNQPQQQQQQQNQGQPPPPGTAIASSSPTSTNPQPKVGEVSTGKQSSPNDSPSAGPNVMQIVSMIQNQQARITATEKTVVQQAEQQAQQAMQQTNDQALNFANNIITQSTNNSMSVATNNDTTKTTKSQSQETGFSLPNMAPTPGSTSVVKATIGPISSETNMVIATTSSTLPKQTEQKTIFESTTVSTSAINLFDGIKQIQQDFTVVNQESKFVMLQPNVTQQFTNTETYNSESSKLVLKSDNNITTNALQIASIDSSESNKLGLKPGMLNLNEQKPVTQLNATTEEKPTTVNKNVQQNELASGVTLATLATQPAGYDAYSLFTLKDASFYAPKEIYKNQRTVDNAKALRVLSSDRLHQEMIDQQYKVKN